MRIAILDYGMGNVRSVETGFRRVGFDALLTRDPEEIRKATHIVLPGVGAFRDCMENLKTYGLIEPLKEALQSGRPFLGICLGLQILFEESEEFGESKGLAIMRGKVVRFRGDMSEEIENRKTGVKRKYPLKIPHMGWNAVRILKDHPILEGIEDGSYFYFVHSYYVVPEDDVAVTTTSYGIDFVSAIARDNIFACQFHPEKSQKVGLRLLKNFARWRP